jgi:hypothetical protein
MAFQTEQRLLELVTYAVGFEYLADVHTPFLHCLSLLDKREHVRMSGWNPLVDEGDSFRLAVAAAEADRAVREGRQ